MDDTKIRYRCPKCDLKAKSTIELAGKTVVCPRCGEKFRIPAPEGTPTPVKPGPRPRRHFGVDLNELTNGGGSSTGSGDDKVCPYCGESLPKHERRCRYCGEWVERRKTLDEGTERLLFKRDHENRNYHLEDRKQCPKCKQWLPLADTSCPFCHWSPHRK